MALLLLGLLQVCQARIFDKCEIAQQLRTYGIAEPDLPDWICLAYQESRYDSGAMGRLNADGSKDHGMFQISDIYWCDYSSAEPYRRYKNLCRASCDDFRDDDISDDMACIMKIHQEHTRLQGNGFMAWVAWRNFCQGTSMAAYDPGDCDVTPATAPPSLWVPPERPSTPSTGAELAPMMPEGKTNGHVRRPQTNLLVRTSVHNKSRLKHYRKDKTGWKAPKRHHDRQPVTWAPSERTTTPSPATRGVTEPSWRRKTTPVNTRWRQWQPRTTTARPWRRQPTRYSWRPQGSQAHPFTGNLFLPKPSTRRPGSSPFTSNIFLSGTSSQAATGRERYRGNVLLSQRGTTAPSVTTTHSSGVIQLDLPPVGDSFGNNPFLSDSSTSSTPQSLEEFQRDLPSITGKFGGNVFLKTTQPKSLGSANRSKETLTRPQSYQKTDQVSPKITSLEDFQLKLPPISGNFRKNIFLQNVPASKHDKIHVSTVGRKSHQNSKTGTIDISKGDSEESSLNLPPISGSFVHNTFLSGSGSSGVGRPSHSTESGSTLSQPNRKTTNSKAVDRASLQAQTVTPRPYQRRRYHTINRSRQPQTAQTRRPTQPNTGSDFIGKLTSPGTVSRTTKRPSFTQSSTTKRPPFTQRLTTKRPSFSQRFTTKRPSLTQRPATKRPSSTQRSKTKRPSIVQRPTTKSSSFTQRPITKRPSLTPRVTTRRSSFSQTPRTKRPSFTQRPTTKRSRVTQRPSTKRPSFTQRPITTRPSFTRTTTTKGLFSTQSSRAKPPNTNRTTRRPMKSYGFSFGG